VSKKRKVVIDDDLDADEDGAFKADDSFDIASLHDDSDDDDVCKVVLVVSLLLMMINIIVTVMIIVIIMCGFGWCS